MAYRSTGQLDDAVASDGDRGFSGVNQRLQNNQLQPGEVRESINGRMDGFWRPRKAVISRVGALTTASEGLSLPFLLIDVAKVISAVSYLANVVTITIAGHGFTVASVGVADLSGITFTGADYNGTVTLTVADANTLTFTTTLVTAVALGGTPRLSGTPLDDTAASDVLASCLFSDPNDSSREYIIVALATVAKKIDLETYAVTSIDYPGANTVAGETEMLQCFGKVILFREGMAAMEWDGSSGAFTVMPGGDYAQPVIMDGASNVVVLNGVATMTHTAHSVDIGDMIEVLQDPWSVPGVVVGDRYAVTGVPTANTLIFFASWADGTYSIVMSKPQSKGAGFMHQPGAPWGTYFQRRLWVPFYYTQSSTAPGTFAIRSVRDEIAASDILDESTYDQIYNQFRITGGTADYVVGMHGFYDDSMIVFNRNSLHIITDTQGSLDDTVVRELTNEVGCLARKSIIMKANTVMFLSDSGVYALTFVDQYNLRGAEEPLSKNIQPYIDRINRDKADKAVGIYHDNRYFLAVPLDSTAGANDAQGNNAVLVFNFLNKAWESLDTYAESAFLIKNFITASAGVRDNLYAVTTNGGLHQLDASDSPNDRLSVTNTAADVCVVPIAASLTSRGYDFGDLERKRFTAAQIQMQNLAGETGEFSVAFSSEDPDNADTVGTTTDFLGGSILSPSETSEAETASIRCRLGGQRGFTGTLILTRTAGNPKIHSLRVSGSVTNRQVISQK